MPSQGNCVLLLHQPFGNNHQHHWLPMELILLETPNGKIYLTKFFQPSSGLGAHPSMVKIWPLHPLSTIFTFSLVYSHCSKAIAAAWLIQCFIFNYPPMFNGCIAVKLPHPQPSTCISTSFLNQPSTIVTCHQHQDAFAHIKGMHTHAHYACSFPSHAVVIHMDLLCHNTEALSLSIFACSLQLHYSDERISFTLPTACTNPTTFSFLTSLDLYPHSQLPYIGFMLVRDRLWTTWLSQGSSQCSSQEYYYMASFWLCWKIFMITLLHCFHCCHWWGCVAAGVHAQSSGDWKHGDSY